MKKRANGEGTSYKLPSGRWCAQISLDGRRVSKTFDTQKEGLDWMHQMRGQISDGLTYAGNRITLSEFMASWLTSTKSSKRASTMVQYQQITNSYIVPRLGQIKLRALKPEHIQRFYTQLLEEKVGAYTILKIHTVLHSALGHACKLGVINRNPASFVDKPKVSSTEMAILNESQVSLLLVTAMGHRWEALYHLAVVTGMRQMELLGLKWSDLDWIKRTLKVERQLAKPDGNGIKFCAPKTRHGRRTITLGIKSVEILRTHYEHQLEERRLAGEGWQENDLIFTTSNGTPIHPRNLLRNFKKLLQDAGLPPIRFHDIRHTSASLLLNQGIPLITVSRRLGHARASITLDIYGHLLPGLQSEIAEIIDDLVMPVSVQLNKTNINT